MSIRADFHLHSSFSGDSRTPTEQMILRGIELGLHTMCFTEHNDFDFPVCEECPEGTFVLNQNSYQQNLLKYKEKYADSIQVLCGIEVGLQPHLAQKNTALVEAYSYDFVIGSVHVCNKEDPYYPSFFEGKSEEECYRKYFNEILNNLKCFSSFDVLGHLDYVVRYGPNKDSDYTYEKYRDIIDLILDRLLVMEKGLEINTSALADGLRETNPCKAVIRRYREMGGEKITVGSDAHNCERVAYEFHTASDLLKECGFRYYTTFEKRIPSFHKL